MPKKRMPQMDVQPSERILSEAPKRRIEDAGAEEKTLDAMVIQSIKQHGP